MDQEQLKRSLLSQLVDSDSDSDFFNEIDSESDQSDFEPKVKRQCIKNYFEEVVPRYSDKEFKTHFRISKVLFDKIACELQTHPETSTNPKTVCTSKQLAVYEACSFRDIGDRFEKESRQEKDTNVGKALRKDVCASLYRSSQK